MEDIKEKKREIQSSIYDLINSINEDELHKKNTLIENQLFEFANFLEANISFLYINQNCEVRTTEILKKCIKYKKAFALPAFDTEKKNMTLMKVENLDSDLIKGDRGILEPDPAKSKAIPIETIDIAIIPGVAFDEKGGRIGSGEGYYDRFISKLPITTRKISLAYEDQIIQQVPMESHDKNIDIIITEKRIIYKI